MPEKLTLQDCFKYPEAVIIRQHNKYDKTAYRNISAFIVHHLISDEMEFQISFCKLILRDIGQLTDEEKQFIHDNYLYDLFKDSAKLSDNVYKSFDELFTICENKVGLINYLREKSIMIEPEDWFTGKAVKG